MPEIQQLYWQLTYLAVQSLKKNANTINSICFIELPLVLTRSVKPKFHGSSFLVTSSQYKSPTCYRDVVRVGRGCYEETAPYGIRAVDPSRLDSTESSLDWSTARIRNRIVEFGPITTVESRFVTAVLTAN